MKVRIGVSLGSAGAADQFAAAVDLLEQAGVDSLWLPENVYSPLVEPFTGLAFALSRTRRLKAGSGISVLPGRHPVLVAKQLASLAGLAPARVLPVFGLQPAQAAERALFPVPAGQRAAVFDESLALLRLMLTSQTVSFEGQFFTVSDASVGPLPAKPMDIWLGGTAPGGLRRVGRLADGWLGSLLSPAEAAAAVETINQAAADAGREVELDHFGLSVPLALDGIPDSLRASISRRRPDTDPETVVAVGLGRRPPADRAVRRGRPEQVRGPSRGRARVVRLVRGRLRPRADAPAELTLQNRYCRTGLQNRHCRADPAELTLQNRHCRADPAGQRRRASVIRRPAAAYGACGSAARGTAGRTPRMRARPAVRRPPRRPPAARRTRAPQPW